MKKLLTFLLAFTLVFVLVGCMDNNPTTEENEPVIEGGDEECTHQFGNPEVTYTDNTVTFVYICVNCGAKKTETQTVDTTVDNAVSWDQTFQNFKLTNFTMKVYIGGRTNPEQVNHCIVTDDAVYYHLARAVEYYAIKKADSSYILYYSEYDYIPNSDNHYSKQPFYYVTGDFAEECLEGAKIETVLQISFAENFNKFTYDSATATYRASELIAAKYYSQTGIEIGTIYCYNNEVKIVNGMISSISCDYLFPEGDEAPTIPETPEYSLDYYNIGVSQVSVPEEIVNNATLGDINQEQPSENENNNNQGNVEVPEINLSDAVGYWTFIHYHQEDSEMSFDFAPGQEVDGYLVAETDFTMTFNDNGSGVYTEFGTNIEFKWYRADENTIVLEFPATGESGVVMLKDSTTMVFINSEKTIQIVFARAK